MDLREKLVSDVPEALPPFPSNDFNYLRYDPHAHVLWLEKATA